jgi:hypothetical protein
VTKGRSARRVLAVLAIAGLGLALTACGDDDDDDAAPAAEADDENADDNDEGDNAEAEDEGDEGEDAAEDEGDDAEAEDEGDDGDDAEAEDEGDDDGDDAEAEDEADDGDTVKVNDLDDIPDECIDLFTDFLKKIEPIVEDVDWENADLSAMESITEELDAEASGMDEEMEDSGCNDYELDDEASMDTFIELAKDEAPGTVAYFEFIQRLQEDFSEITIPEVDTADDGGDDEAVDFGDTGDVPQDCQGAIDYMRDLMDQYDSMMDMTVTEMSGVGTASGVISSTCSVNEMNEFFNDPAVTEWMSGT